MAATIYTAARELNHTYFTLEVVLMELSILEEIEAIFPEHLQEQFRTALDGLRASADKVEEVVKVIVSQYP